MIFFLKGQIESGKSTALMNWINGKRDAYGIICPIESDGKRYFYDIASKTKFIMQANSDDDGIIHVGRYHFFKSAFKRANAILNKVAKNYDSGVVIIDELGKLELKNKGLHTSAKRIIHKTKDSSSFHAILVVRSSLVDNIKEHYKLLDITELNKGQLKHFMLV